MKEGWGLIQSRQNKKDIKIQGTKLYLKGNLYGSVIDFKFVLCSNGESASLTKLAIIQNTDTISIKPSSASPIVSAVANSMDTTTSTPSS